MEKFTISTTEEQEGSQVDSQYPDQLPNNCIIPCSVTDGDSRPVLDITSLSSLFFPWRLSIVHAKAHLFWERFGPIGKNSC